MSDKTFFITTPIYYINSTPHIGHAYTQIAADTRARFERMRGRKVYFLTGTDEHGAKVARAAKELGRDAQEHADDLSAQFRALWDTLGISYDDYIRTTEPRHKHVAQAIVEKLWNDGNLYLGTYSGWYSVPDETFFRPEDTVERDGAHYLANPSEDQTRAPLEWIEETTHFFELAKWQEPLLEYYAAHRDVLAPEARRNEVLAFLRAGLRDASVTRELEWGIVVPPSVPHAEDHSIYVWFEALMNYLSAPGYLSDDEAMRERFADAWPPDLQLMSKDIFTRFHATLWPAMLMCLDLPLPKQLFAHGFWTVDGRKMSKRDVETIVEPIQFAQEMADAAGCDLSIAIDALRYYCLREVTFGSDGDFSRPGCVSRYNSDLANGLGNLVNRTLSMLHQYFDGIVPQAQQNSDLHKTCNQALPLVEQAYEEMEFSTAFTQIWNLITVANQAIEEEKPWAKIKSGDREAVAALLADLLAICNFCAITLSPALPHAMKKFFCLLNVPEQPSWLDAINAPLPAGHVCKPPIPIFPRISATPAAKGTTMSTSENTPEVITESQSTPLPVRDANDNVVANVTPAPITKEHIAVEQGASTERALIEYEDFAKIDLRIATILSAERIPKADKLLKLQVDLGTEQRQILAGIAQQFEPETLIGKQIVVVANLAPRKMRGLESQGMLLAASPTADAPPAALLVSEIPVPSGSIVR